MRSGELYFNYQFNSPSTFEGGRRYINSINLNLSFLDLSEDAPDELEKIGEIGFDRVFAGEIFYDERYRVFDIFDEDSEFYASDGFKITNGYKFHKSLTNRWRELGIHDNSFIYIYEYWLKPEFRGQKIILKAILDLINEFRHGIDLIVILIRPILHSEILKHPEIFNESEKYPIRKYNQTLSKQKITNHLGEVGFEKIKGFKDLMFLFPGELEYEVFEKFHLSEEIKID